MDAHIHLVVWCAFVWIIGPLGRDFRDTFCYIFDACHAQGECVLYDSCIYSPQEYLVLERSPKSCVICGLDAWCVEMVYVEGTTRYMCEHHVNPEAISPMHCGSKLCRFTECPHHPMTGKGMKQLDFVRAVNNGYKQGMVEWSGDQRRKEIGYQ